MLPFLFSANDRAKNRKRGNYAGDKSRMHLKSLREKSTFAGMRRKLPRNFCKAKARTCRVILMSWRLLRLHRNQPASFSSG
jgi:hypothetical protein